MCNVFLTLISDSAALRVVAAVLFSFLQELSSACEVNKLNFPYYDRISNACDPTYTVQMSSHLASLQHQDIPKAILQGKAFGIQIIKPKLILQSFPGEMSIMCIELTVSNLGALFEDMHAEGWSLGHFLGSFIIIS